MQSIFTIFTCLLLFLAAADELPKKLVPLGPNIPSATILSVTRYDQSSAIKNREIEKEYTLPELFADLESFQVVSKLPANAAHTVHLTGEISIRDHGTYFWDIHPHVSAVLRNPFGHEIFLLNKNILNNMMPGMD